MTTNDKLVVVENNLRLESSKPNNFHFRFTQHCDTINNFKLSINLPSLPDEYTYVPNIENELILDVSLKIGRSVMQRFNGKYMIATKGTNVITKNGNVIHVNLPFILDTNVCDGLPLVALKYHELRFDLITKPLDELIIKTVTDSDSAKTFELSRDNIIVHIDSSYQDVSFKDIIVASSHKIRTNIIHSVEDKLIFGNYDVIEKMIDFGDIDYNCNGVVITFTKKDDTSPVNYYKLITHVCLELDDDSNKITYVASAISDSGFNKAAYNFDICEGAYYIPFSIGNADKPRLFIMCDKTNVDGDTFDMTVFYICSEMSSIKQGRFIP